MTAPGSKLAFEGRRVAVSAGEAEALASGIFRAAGCPEPTARAVAAHLVDADLCGMESHGLIRALRYDEDFRSGRLDPVAEPVVRGGGAEPLRVDARGGIGIPAMDLATREAVAAAGRDGMAAVGLVEAGHTGRLGAFAEWGAEQGCLVMIVGGGGRTMWRQVAPHGGARARLPTNPYAFAIPGGERGPVVLDFATGAIAGGWILAARSAGARLPEGAVIDRAGRPTTDPEDYFAGGAILPAGGPKGYALAVMAELVAEAMLGPVSLECHWLVLAIDCARWRAPSAMRATAEDVLADLRACPPAGDHARVEIPGERERDARAASGGIVRLPERTWAALRARAEG
jgi:LDH2 family malate/lactate/ureidoglycolate dehydrogenase